MISRRLWSALRRLASYLSEGCDDIGLSICWVDPMLFYAYQRMRKDYQAKAGIGQDGPGPVPVILCGPPPGHPEQLVNETSLTPAEARLWRELEEEL